MAPRSMGWTLDRRPFLRPPALRTAALSPYVPSRIVQMLDPQRDPVLIGRAGYQAEAEPVVYATVGRTTREAVRTVDDLTRVIEQIEWDRRGKLR